MRAFTWSTVSLSALLLLCCQPIMIGNPREASEGGAGGVASSGGAHSAGAKAGTGFGGAGRGSAVDGSPQGGTGHAGAGSEAGGSDAAAGDSAAGDGAGGSDSCTDGTLTIHGRITSPRGAPIVGVSISLTPAAETTAMATAESDANGDYAFESLCPGRYVVAPQCAANAGLIELSSDVVQDFYAELAGGCATRVLESRPLIVIYDPTMTGNGPAQSLSTLLGVDPPELVLRLLDLLRAVTNGHVQQETARVLPSLGFPLLLDGFRYTASDYAACLTDPQQCHAAVGADYAAMNSEQSLCQVVREQNADQIWVLGGAHFGFLASRQMECHVIEGEPGQEHEVVWWLDVIGMDYSSGFAGILAGYQAHSDLALRQVFGAAPPDSTADAPDNPYGLFTQAVGLAPAAEASGCGNSSFAPNSLEPGVFDDERAALSYCDAFWRYPLSEPPLEAAVPTSCAAWGCTELGFRGYWFSHLPKAPWLDSRGKLNDFWRYILRVEERLPLPPISVTCSTNYLPGWCGHVVDGQQGECNSGEWATKTEATGWVEFLFDPPRMVSGAQLYDRACDEQVLSGHLEFSDGSSDEIFGELEGSGMEFTSVSFAPKLLTGLRVVIDTSQGYNPGFGEITLASSPP